MVTRYTLLKELSELVPDDVLVLTSIGNNSGFWGQLKDRQANLFHLTMGMCSSTALGLSLALPKRKIVAVDSDGNRGQNALRSGRQRLRHRERLHNRRRRGVSREDSNCALE